MGSKGYRESEWRVLNRCLTLLLRLMRGGATTEDLHKIIIDDVGNERKVSDKAVKRMFEEDKRRLKDWFHVEINFSRSNSQYELIHLGRSLVDLSEDAVRGFAFLEQTFSDDSAPAGVDVRSLLHAISVVIPYERRQEISKQRSLEMELSTQDTDQIPPDVWEAVKTSTDHCRQLEFLYGSPQREDKVFHQVEPIRYFFDVVRKHYYLEFFWLYSQSGAYGRTEQNYKVARFRLDRMSNPKVLPNHFNPNRRIPSQELIYELSANIARLDVTEHFPEMQVYPNEDGSVKVIAQSRDLFFDLRTLLHYGANCRVIGGEEALYQMKRLIKDMAKVYEGD